LLVECVVGRAAALAEFDAVDLVPVQRPLGRGAPGLDLGRREVEQAAQRVGMNRAGEQAEREGRHAHEGTESWGHT